MPPANANITITLPGALSSPTTHLINLHCCSLMISWKQWWRMQIRIEGGSWENHHLRLHAPILGLLVTGLNWDFNQGWSQEAQPTLSPTNQPVLPTSRQFGHRSPKGKLMNASEPPSSLESLPLSEPPQRKGCCSLCNATLSRFLLILL